MKTTFKISVLALLFFFVKKIEAQCSGDFFLLSPQSKISRNALGFGFNVFTQPLSVGSDLEIRLGGGVHGSLLMNNNFRDVPLASPQVGNSTVKFNNWLYGGNGMLRFSAPYSNNIIPYVDVFGGLQGYSCYMTVEPDKASASQYSTTTESIADMGRFNYGFSAGVMFSLTDDFKLDLGLTSLFAKQAGQVVDMKSTRIEPNGITLSKMDAPLNTLMFKVGIVFYIHKGSSQSSATTSHACSNNGFFSSNTGGSSGGNGSGGHVNLNFKPSK